MNPFQSLRDYEEFIYSLKQSYQSIQRATLVVVQRGRRAAILFGELTFVNDYRITVKEQLTLDTGSITIDDYGYELWSNGNKIAWYDAQPHPNNPALASTHPHHKHVPPDIKHNRRPAPEMSFTQPNLPALIREIEALIDKAVAK